MKSFWFLELSESEFLNKRSWTCNNIFLKGWCLAQVSWEERLSFLLPYLRSHKNQHRAAGWESWHPSRFPVPLPFPSQKFYDSVCFQFFFLSALCLRLCWPHCSCWYPYLWNKTEKWLRAKTLWSNEAWFKSYLWHSLAICWILGCCLTSLNLSLLHSHKTSCRDIIIINETTKVLAFVLALYQTRI